MTVRYSAGFDLAKIGPFQVTLDDTASSGSAQLINMTSGTYAHVSMAAASPVSGYTAFAAALQSAINAVKTRDYTVQWTNNSYYAIEQDLGGDFKLTFSTAVGGASTTAGMTLGARMLGFPGTVPFSTAVGNPITATAVSYYHLIADITARTAYSGLLNHRGLAKVGVSDDGIPYHARKLTPARIAQWEQVFEAQAKVFPESAASTAPWTWRHLIEHGASGEPISVYDSNTSTTHVFKLREDGCDFDDSIVRTSTGDPNYVAYWDISFKGHYLGAL